MSPLSDADLRGAVEAADRDVTGKGGEADARGLVELDRAVRALEGDVAEPSDGPEFGAGRLASMREPPGSWTVTSMDPELPRIWFSAEASISSGQPSFSSRVIMARPNAVALVLPNLWRIRGSAG